MANSYLNRTQGSATNQKKGTFSFWIKRSKLGSNQRIVTNYNDSNNLGYLRFNSSDQLQHYALSGGSAIGSIISTRKFRDTSAWYHIVMAIDTTQSTAADRIKFYVNGVQETSFGTNTIPSQNADHPIFASGTHYIGRHSSDADYFDGYISHAAQVDGTALAPTVFGQTDSTSGIWNFKAPSTTWGNNGYHLKFENAGALGTDSSGNTNTFTVNGNLKQSPDTPSNSYATWNFLSSPSNGNIGDVTGSNGNTTTSYFAQYRSYPATLGFKSGKWYWEVKRKSTSNDFHLGICSENLTPANQATWVGSTANGWIYAGDGGDLYNNNSNPGSSGYATLAVDDIVGVAYDADNGKLYFSKNGTFQNSSNPVNGTNPAFSGLDTSLFYFPVITAGANSETNFGNGFFGTTAVTSNSGAGEQDDAGEGKFQYDVPAGYYAVNTKNINTYG